MTIDVNTPPDCSTVTPNPDSLWPPNHKLELVTSLEDSTGELRSFLRCLTCGQETDYIVHDPDDDVLTERGFALRTS